MMKDREKELLGYNESRCHGFRAPLKRLHDKESGGCIKELKIPWSKLARSQTKSQKMNSAKNMNKRGNEFFLVQPPDDNTLWSIPCSRS
jgi:hypothetical protein